MLCNFDFDNKKHISIYKMRNENLDCFSYIKSIFININEFDNHTNEEKAFFKFLNGVYTDIPFINKLQNKMLEYINNEEWRNMYKEAISAYNTAIQVGEVRGREQGIEVGREQGIENTLINTVKLLKEMGLNNREIIIKLNNLNQYKKQMIEDIVNSL